MSCAASAKLPCFGAFLLAIAALGGCFGGRVSQLKGAAIETPSAVYGIELSSLQGGRHTLGSYNGKVVLLTFWAPWCTLCRSEMASLAILSRNFRGKDLLIIGIAVQSSAEQVQAWKREQGKLPFEVLLDDQGQAQRFFELSALPVAVVVSRHGAVVPFPDPESGKLSTRIEGPRDWGSYESVRAFAKLLQSE